MPDLESYERRRVSLIGVPMDLGAGRRGVDMGPSAVRLAGVARRLRDMGHEFEDLGDVAVPLSERREPGPGPKYLKDILRTCGRLAPRIERVLDQGGLPMVVGGDHSFAMGSITGVSSHFRKRGEKVGLIWIDAHADMNTPETSPSGNIHGMPLSAVLGYGDDSLVGLGGFSPKVDPENTVLIGIRSVDDGERDLVIRSGIHYYEMMKIDARGMGNVVEEALARASQGTAGVHVSLDADGIDPEYAPGVGTPVPGGINLREAHLLLEMVADSGLMCSLDVAEVNPILDTANTTAELMVELISSALGKKVMGSLPSPPARTGGLNPRG